MLADIANITLVQCSFSTPFIITIKISKISIAQSHYTQKKTNSPLRMFNIVPNSNQARR